MRSRRDRNKNTPYRRDTGSAPRREQTRSVPGTPTLESGGTRRMRLVLDERVDPRQLVGMYDEHLKMIEDAFEVNVSARGNLIIVDGDIEDHEAIGKLFRNLEQLAVSGAGINRNTVADAIRHFEDDESEEAFRENSSESIRLRKMRIQVRNSRQREFLNLYQKKDLVFAIGPAGTGKTYMAVAFACHALQEGHVERMILTRPAVEAGEKLGFLPGDLAEKINPYLRPLYDALYEMLGPEKVMRYMDRGIIEVAPLAFMRGRTLNNSFIILDEAQNTTSEQMKMFLTRLGQRSKAIVTGDVTQIDLPKEAGSGLVQAWEYLREVDGIGFLEFERKDIVRHRLVQRIVDAYEHHSPRPEMKIDDRIRETSDGEGAIAVSREETNG